ncbi:DUF945 family protein [Vibrio scophthalmi]|uniref:DUF945 family protein n=1 Tax=Vibrio scophthalmi TaxID=45658 RepID=UPI002FF2632B
MYQLKKIGAIGGAISLALCWPLAVGQIGQNVIQDGIRHLNSAAMSADVVSYDRGYLSSKVTTRYVIHDQELAAQMAQDGLPSEFIVHSDLTHGLVSLDADSVIEGLEAIPLTLHTSTQLNGNTRYTVSMDSWNYVAQGADNAVLSMSPSTLSGQVTVLGEVSYELDMPSADIDFNHGESLHIVGLKGSGSGKKQGSFWLGEQTLSVDEVTLTDPAQAVWLGLKQGQYRVTSSMDEVNQTVSSQHVVRLNDVIGQEGEVKSVGFDLTFGGLDMESFDHLVNIYQNNPVLSENEIEQAISQVETLFTKGFYLTMNKLDVDLGDGAVFDSTWTVAVPEGTSGISQNPMMVIPALTGEINTYFSNQLVEQYPFIKQGVDEAIVMEFISQTQQGYQIQATLEQGNLVFNNGQKIPLMTLFLSAMMQP